MNESGKVLWTEGMFLRPQHFQQQERHWRTWVEHRCQGLIPHGWGLLELEMDDALLANGKFALNRCRGVLPDGTPFSAPDRDLLPSPLEVPGDAKNAKVVLTLPLQRPNQPLCGYDGDADLARYLPAETVCRDLETHGNDEEAVVETGQLNLRLALLDTIDAGAFATLPLARITECKEDGAVILDRDFIPTALTGGVSRYLSSLVREIEGLLNHRSQELAERLASPGAGGVAEVMDFLFLQVINRHLPLFGHLARSNGFHPEDLYRTLLQLAGELETITAESRRPQEIPAYVHSDLQPAFQALAEAIRTSLSWVPEGRAVPIPLKPHKHGVHVAVVADADLFTRAVFVLAANAQLPAEKLRALLPRQTTVASPDKLRDLVMTHTPGVVLMPLPVAPRQIPFHAGFSYFELDRHSSLWQELARAKALAMHIAGEYPGLELELWALKS